VHKYYKNLTMASEV